MSAQGELFKAFDIKDGCGIHDLLPRARIVPVVITARTSEIVAKRCLELGIERCYQGCRNKEAKLLELAEEMGFAADDRGVYPQIACMGDDIVDLPCMERCGVVGCPADAVEEVCRAADFLSTKPGGRGAVREFIEWLIETGV